MLPFKLEIQEVLGLITRQKILLVLLHNLFSLTRLLLVILLQLVATLLKKESVLENCKNVPVAEKILLYFHQHFIQKISWMKFFWLIRNYGKTFILILIILQKCLHKKMD